jgi:hypothetical protein
MILMQAAASVVVLQALTLTLFPRSKLKINSTVQYLIKSKLDLLCTHKNIAVTCRLF